MSPSRDCVEPRNCNLVRPARKSQFSAGVGACRASSCRIEQERPFFSPLSHLSGGEEGERRSPCLLVLSWFCLGARWVVLSKAGAVLRRARWDFSFLPWCRTSGAPRPLSEFSDERQPDGPKL